MADANQTNDTPAGSSKTVSEPLFFRPLGSPAVVISAVILVLAIIGGAFFWSINSGIQNDGAGTSEPSSTATNSAQTTNVWQSVVSPTSIPLGDGNVSTAPKVGYIFSCTTNFRGGGAEHSGDWLDAVNGTWNSEIKVAVQGAISWPNASYSVKTSGSSRIITTNDLPESDITGVFPIALNDPAYQYDRNPNSIGVQNLTYTLPLNPTAASSPQCTSLGAIGVLTNGALLYNGLDAAGRDAVAHETQDSCDGHPDGGDHYHYHDISSCILDAATSSSTLVGYALDGYGIYVERDSAGNLPTNADLDECHGRTSEVLWNGTMTTIYHYSATIEYPFTIGCFHGTPVASQR